VDAGARQIECTINGIGERAGNCFAGRSRDGHARARRSLAVRYRHRRQELYPTSQLLSQIIGFGVQPNKAIVGRNAFAHEAGIHQHGVISNPLCYEIMTPDSVGVPANALVLGKHSGRHALGLRYEELGYSLEPGELNQVYHRFTELADRKKRIYDQDLISLIETGTRTEAVIAAERDQWARIATA
jgi:2-isopropylmalate synthase